MPHLHIYIYIISSIIPAFPLIALSLSLIFSRKPPPRAAGGLNGVEFEGSKLHAEQLDKNQRRSQRNQRNPYPGMPGPGRQADFPLRILVQSEMVGAIIGRQGSTIRTITQQSRARVDVHRKENVGSVEKSITIYGNPENCTNACKRILEVMQQEALSTNKG